MPGPFLLWKEVKTNSFNPNEASTKHFATKENPNAFPGPNHSRRRVHFIYENNIKAALFLFSVAVLLAGGAAAVRGQSALDGFDPNANGTVCVVVVQPDGKILIGGDFTTLSPNGGAAVTRNRIARLNPDGTLDTAFNPNANSVVLSIAVQADGKILVGGVSDEQHRRTDAQPHRPARCHHRLG